MNQRHYSHQKRPAHTFVSPDRATGAAIAHLPMLVRWIMLLGGQHGLSTKEIANLSGTSIKTVKSIQDRGHKLIESELQMLV